MKRTIITSLILFLLSQISTFVFADMDYLKPMITIQGSPTNNIKLLLTSPDNKRTGYDIINNIVVKEIPGSGYVLNGNGEADEDAVWELSNSKQVMEGIYTLNVIGNKAGFYKIGVLLTNKGMTTKWFQGYIDKGEIQKVTINFNFPLSNSKIEKEVNIKLLRNETKLIMKDLVKDKRLSDELLREMDIISNQKKLNKKSFTKYIKLLKNADNKYQPKFNIPVLKRIDELIREQEILKTPNERILEMIRNEIEKENYEPEKLFYVRLIINEKKGDFSEWYGDESPPANLILKEKIRLTERYLTESSFFPYRANLIEILIKNISGMIKEKNGKEKPETILKLISDTIKKEIQQKNYKLLTDENDWVIQEIFNRKDLSLIKDSLKDNKSIKESSQYKAIQVLIQDTNILLDGLQ